ncbi:MAG: PIN domain nuclease [Dehalococcoidia bacterium]|nr:PIN domain nuclease [Dehalococcoidia bacterium]
MSNKLVLIDTSVWILFLRKHPPPVVEEEVGRLLAEDSVAISPMIRLELLGGTRTSAEFNRLQGRLDALHRLPADEATWDKAAELAFLLRQQGKVIPYTDLLIGAAAIVADVLLLHADRHFDLMAEDSNLRVRSMVRQEGEE